MTFTKFRSRKLLLLLAFLQLDLDPYERQSWLPSNEFFEDPTIDQLFTLSSQPTPPRIANNGTVWIVDEGNHECLGPHGFSQCGDLSGWLWIEDGSYVKLRHLESSSENHCLGWKWLQKKFEIMDCDILKTPLYSRRTRNIHWNFDFDAGYLQTPIGFLETVLPFSPYCAVNDNRKRLQRCNRAATKLRVVPLADISFLTDDLKQSDGDEVMETESLAMTGDTSILVTQDFGTPLLLDQGYWHCPVTGLALPRNLDKYEHLPPINDSERSGRQVLMGAGVFTKVVFGMKFHVYNLGWYVDAAAAQTDPQLLPFVGKTFPELQASKKFYEALLHVGGYDRTMYIKLAMSLKKDVVIQGIVEELPLQPKNAKILLEASEQYPHKECLEGMEILFKWRQPREANNFQERLDIVIGDYVITIREPGLAADFFYHYMLADDPVSEEAQADFPHNFPLVLNGPPYQPSNESMLTATMSSSSSASAGYPFDINDSRPLNKRFSFTKLAASYLGQDHRQVRRMRRWKAYMNSLLLKEYKRWKQDLLITVAVLVYCFVLVAISLPPALIERGVRVVNRVRTKSIQQLNEFFETTLSRSQSLATLAKSKSLSAMVRSASSDFKSFFHNNFQNMN